MRVITVLVFTEWTQPLPDVDTDPNPNPDPNPDQVFTEWTQPLPDVDAVPGGARGAHRNLTNHDAP